MKVEIPEKSFQATYQSRLRLFRDFNSNSEFVAIFIPFFGDARMTDVIEGFIDNLKKNIKEAIDQAKLIGIEQQTPGTAISRSGDLVFSGRVFIYTSNSLDAIQIEHLVESYRKDGLYLEIRGSDYLYYRSKT